MSDFPAAVATLMPAPLRLSLILACLAIVTPCVARAEDGYELWLRYHTIEAPWQGRYRLATREIVASDSASAAVAELRRGIVGLLGLEPRIRSRPTRDGAIVLGTPQSSSLIAGMHLDLHDLTAEGYLLHSTSAEGRRVIVVAGNSEAGVLHGTFTLLRLMQTRRSVAGLDLRGAPRIQRRLLDHWDNLDGTIERGYAGASIWDWQKLPDYLAPRYVDYARACASLGINGTVLTNVNADAVSLTPAYLKKAAALAGVFRPYGLRVYLAARFTAPMELGGLKTADPLDPEVRRWWQSKVDEIYRYIPDLGGFVVKANSEGQPGPRDYGRSHADGANLFADVLAPHGGVVMWRAFVYANRQGEDRARQAFDAFAPLDGRFRDNVMIQSKNGPIDFQPREPVHPLFGGMPKTPMVLELQITKEYLGFATHLVYLGPLYQEILGFDTVAEGQGSTVARIIDGSLDHHALSGIAGVSNIGADRNWTGSNFAQANWYAYGRLAWDPTLDARDLAGEWVRMTFSNDPRFVGPVVALMMGSREAAVDYMTPLGLAHLMAAGHHYGPGAWQHADPPTVGDPPYFHRADAEGIGFDRTSSGSNAASQYSPPVAALFQDPQRTPEKFLLWFHHLPWDYRMASGHTLWDELVMHYTQGVTTVRGMRATWATLAPYVDAQRFTEVSRFLSIQEQEAQWWRDATLAYFQSISHRPFPTGYDAPQRTLAEYEAISVPYAPGNPGWTAAPFRH